MGYGISPALLWALEEGHPRARTVAAHLCGIGGVRAAAPLLVTLLESHDDPTVAAAAAAALGKVGRPQDAGALSAATLHFFPFEVRHAAIEALGELGVEAAVPVLTRHLGDPSSQVAEAAATSLIALGPRGRRAVVDARARARRRHRPRARAPEGGVGLTGSGVYDVVHDVLELVFALDGAAGPDLLPAHQHLLPGPGAHLRRRVPRPHGPQGHPARPDRRRAGARCLGHRPGLQRGGADRLLGAGPAHAALPPARGRGRRRREHRRHARGARPRLRPGRRCRATTRGRSRSGQPSATCSCRATAAPG